MATLCTAVDMPSQFVGDSEPDRRGTKRSRMIHAANEDQEHDDKRIRSTDGSSSLSRTISYPSARCCEADAEILDLLGGLSAESTILSTEEVLSLWDVFSPDSP
eukprot:CAMPEP_0196661396 /NCGR_PEP_ID=MMETSP1086-20130531/44016_1 /TAXON_ID=77921 /ORGANISM="Cyanoptyche  gloeocystis , Strain SAG4.97" /LENGTH=103 /DNA_ID=CAMNT_0041996261 /DNA_START=53 /DNA_END=364 /DNA_ORIENTATION=+